MKKILFFLLSFSLLTGNFAHAEQFHIYRKNHLLYSNLTFFGGIAGIIAGLLGIKYFKGKHAHFTTETKKYDELHTEEKKNLNTLISSLADNLGYKKPYKSNRTWQELEHKGQELEERWWFTRPLWTLFTDGKPFKDQGKQLHAQELLVSDITSHLRISQAAKASTYTGVLASGLGGIGGGITSLILGSILELQKPLITINDTKQTIRYKNTILSFRHIEKLEQEENIIFIYTHPQAWIPSNMLIINANELDTDAKVLIEKLVSFIERSFPNSKLFEFNKS